VSGVRQGNGCAVGVDLPSDPMSPNDGNGVPALTGLKRKRGLEWPVFGVILPFKRVGIDLGSWLLSARKGHRTPEKSSGMNDWKVILNQPRGPAIVGHG
jgi:hypothetical protein